MITNEYQLHHACARARMKYWKTIVRPPSLLMDRKQNKIHAERRVNEKTSFVENNNSNNGQEVS